MKKYKTGYTTGVFDMFHIGHLNILRRAKSMCDTLIVGVTTDELCLARKHKLPIIPQSDRVAIIQAIRYVDQVVLQEDMDKLTAVRRLNADVVFVGTDWKGTPQWQTYERQLSEAGCDVVYLPHTDGISSTSLAHKASVADKDTMPNT